jgi:hypothetical protein
MTNEPPSTQSAIRALPLLDQPEAKTRDIAAQIQLALQGTDPHSAHFHLLVASRVPEKIIHAHLADIRADGARNPGALFTYRMTQYAKARLEAAQPNLSDRMNELMAAKRIP